MSLSIAPYCPSWSGEFESESEKIRRALGQNIAAIHHIGSTSIPDILSKPIIDILVEVLRLDELDQQAQGMSQLNYESMDEHGIAGRRYFRRSGPDGDRAFHVHCFESESEYVFRHLVFRDYLLAHPAKAQEYSNLKSRLIEIGTTSTSEYQKMKAPFVEATIQEAIEWFNSRR